MNTDRIRQVAIVGGTHGNELTGVYLVKKFEQRPDLIQRSSFTTSTLLANPKALAVGKRYFDRDLNRCFLSQDIADVRLTSYEENRAKDIYQLLGPKENPSVDFIIDLHSTTANMGLTIIPSSNHPFNLRLAAYLSTVHPLVKIYRWSASNQENAFLRSISKLGCTIEVGAVPQGVLQASCFQQTETLIHLILDYLHAYNCGQATAAPSTFTIYQCVELVDYPRHQQDLQAMIHPQLQGKDYLPLHPDDPMFLTLDQQTIAYAGQSIVYPVFINEAAYYEKQIAMCLTERQQVWLSET